MIYPVDKFRVCSLVKKVNQTRETGCVMSPGGVRADQSSGAHLFPRPTNEHGTQHLKHSKTVRLDRSQPSSLIKLQVYQFVSFLSDRRAISSHQENFGNFLLLCEVFRGENSKERIPPFPAIPPSLSPAGAATADGLPRLPFSY